MNATARRKRRSSRTALVLGGGGFTGGVYQIGALRALDLLSSNRSVNQFDIYVGTSAGALIASLVANGVTPEQMMRTVNDQVPHSLPPLDREMFLRLNKGEFALQGGEAAAARGQRRAQRGALARRAVRRRPRARSG